MLKDPATTMPIYSSQDPYHNGLGRFIRNPNCWLNGVSNISCFSPAQLSGAAWNQRAGTLITKKHIVLAKHFVFAILEGGTPIIFVDENNNVIRRNLVQYANDSVTDISIGLLDNEIPSNIKIAKVLPKNYQLYMGYPEDMLAVAIDQQEKAILKTWTGLLNYITSGVSYQYVNVVSPDVNYARPDFFQYVSFNEDIVTGDSGNPMFIILDNELVLLSCWHTPWSGPFITDRYDTVNSLIESLSPGENYSLTPVNLEAIYNSLINS